MTGFSTYSPMRDVSMTKREVTTADVVQAIENARIKQNHKLRAPTSFATVNTFQVADELGRGLHIARQALRRAALLGFVIAEPPINFGVGSAPREWRVARAALRAHRRSQR